MNEGLTNYFIEINLNFLKTVYKNIYILYIY